MAPRRTLIVLGIMGQAPFAGIAWQLLHFLEGLRRLGHDVYYVEDTYAWPFDPVQNTITSDFGYAVKFIGRMMDWCGLPDRWAYRAPPQAGGVVTGLSETELNALYLRADALINVTGSTLLHEKQLQVPIRIYLETDPILPQIEVAHGNSFWIELLSAHTHHFTYGENIGKAHCSVPVGRFKYFPTRQPIVLDWWSAGCSPPLCFTTVANWQQSGKDLAWNGEVYYWSKHYEFLRFLELPQRTAETFEMALSNVDEAAIHLLKSHGWQVRDAALLSKDILPYRDYLLSSMGEFTVAKDQNIRFRSGWFSDRSACYLAAGRPVITQDTAFGTVLPTGEGLFAFRTMDEVLTALDAIRGDYAHHSHAARAIAEQHFKAEAVLKKLLDSADL
jgi:hypothetical protein